MKIMYTPEEERSILYLMRYFDTRCKQIDKQNQGSNGNIFYYHQDPLIQHLSEKLEKIKYEARLRQDKI